MSYSPKTFQIKWKVHETINVIELNELPTFCNKTESIRLKNTHTCRMICNVIMQSCLTCLKNSNKKSIKTKASYSPCITFPRHRSGGTHFKSNQQHGAGSPRESPLCNSYTT